MSEHPHLWGRIVAFIRKHHVLGAALTFPGVLLGLAAAIATIWPVFTHDTIPEVAAKWGWDFVTLDRAHVIGYLVGAFVLYVLVLALLFRPRKVTTNQVPEAPVDDKALAEAAKEKHQSALDAVMYQISDQINSGMYSIAAFVSAVDKFDSNEDVIYVREVLRKFSETKADPLDALNMFMTPEEYYSFLVTARRNKWDLSDGQKVVALFLQHRSAPPPTPPSSKSTIFRLRGRP